MGSANAPSWGGQQPAPHTTPSPHCFKYFTALSLLQGQGGCCRVEVASCTRGPHTPVDGTWAALRHGQLPSLGRPGQRHGQLTIVGLSQYGFDVGLSAPFPDHSCPHPRTTRRHFSSTPSHFTTWAQRLVPLRLSCGTLVHPPWLANKPGGYTCRWIRRCCLWFDVGSWYHSWSLLTR